MMDAGAKCTNATYVMMTLVIWSMARGGDADDVGDDDDDDDEDDDGDDDGDGFGGGDCDGDDGRDADSDDQDDKASLPNLRGTKR